MLHVACMGEAPACVILALYFVLTEHFVDLQGSPFSPPAGGLQLKSPTAEPVLESMLESIARNEALKLI